MPVFGRSAECHGPSARAARLLQLGLAMDAGHDRTSDPGSAPAGRAVLDPSRGDTYDLIAPLGAGGRGVVHLARHHTVEGGRTRLVALKRAVAGSALKEEIALSRVSSPHVVPLLDAFDSPDGGRYLVLRYVRGGSLSRLLRVCASSGRRVPPGIAVRIVLDVLRGLGALHDAVDADGSPACTLHGDLSPGNVLLGADGLAYLCDLGFASLLATEPDSRLYIDGTPGYMAPEYAFGQRRDRSSEVFGVGILLWEAMAGRVLFPGQTSEAMGISLRRPAPALRDVVPAIAGRVARVCARALELEPQRRYASTAEFEEELEAAAVDVGPWTSRVAVATFVRGELGPWIAQLDHAVERHSIMARMAG